MVRTRGAFLALLAAAGLVLASPAAWAADPVKVGVIAPMSGPFAEFGAQFKAGVEAYQSQQGTEAAGRQVEVIYKDVGGPKPDVAKRLAQELITRDRVDILSGFGFTPNAIAVAPLATEAEVPMLIMNAAGNDLTRHSPYMVRLSFELPSVVPPMAKWAVDQGYKKVFLLVSDYAPGHDVEKAFLEAFPQVGGTVVDNLRTPLMTLDFSPFMQRIKDAQPDAIFAFVNAGDVLSAFLKAYREKGLDQAGIALLGTGDITDEPSMNALGDAALGIVTTYPYSMDHDSPENEVFVETFQSIRGDDARPSIMGVAAFDVMQTIYAALEKTGGNSDGTALVDAMKGLQIESPRGPISIDPETRDIVQTIYIRRVEKEGDRLVNKEFDSFPPN